MSGYFPCVRCWFEGEVVEETVEMEARKQNGGLEKIAANKEPAWFRMW